MEGSRGGHAPGCRVKGHAEGKMLMCGIDKEAH